MSIKYFSLSFVYVLSGLSGLCFARGWIPMHHRFVVRKSSKLSPSAQISRLILCQKVRHPRLCARGFFCVFFHYWISDDEKKYEKKNWIRKNFRLKKRSSSSWTNSQPGRKNELTILKLRKPFCCIRMHHRAGWFSDAEGDSSCQFRVQHFCALYGWARRWTWRQAADAMTSPCIWTPCRTFLCKSHSQKNISWNWRHTTIQQINQRQPLFLPPFHSPANLLIEIVIFLHVFASLNAHLTVGKCQVDIWKWTKWLL